MVTHPLVSSTTTAALLV